MRPDELQDIDAFSLCMAYGNPFARTKTIRDELQRRHVFDAEEWRLIDRRELKVGSTLNMMVASWGIPNANNRTRTAEGIEVQHIYGTGRYERRRYVYTNNGIITGIQD